MTTLYDCSDAGALSVGNVSEDDILSLTSVSSNSLTELNRAHSQPTQASSVSIDGPNDATTNKIPSPLLTADQWKDKRDAIEDCLRGRSVFELGMGLLPPSTHATESLDLWHLRELSVSNGGLLDPSLRKRAWPLLTQAFLKQSHEASTEPVTPSANDILMLQRDVRFTVWNVQEKYREHQDKNKQAVEVRNDERVTFATARVQTGTPQSPVGDLSNAKESLDSSSTSALASDATDSSAVSSVVLEESTLATTENLTSTAASLRQRVRMAYRKTNSREQKIVANVITSCLRMAPPESEAFEDDRFRYFTGLHDLTALIMINMESPSLTSLVLGKLASFHLRDAMRKDGSVLDTALQLIFFPLLQVVDAPLHDFIVRQARVIMPTFAISWVANWFATDVTDIGAASRFVDFFLASHATAPLYCAVALVTLFRQEVLSCEPEPSILHMMLCSLPHRIADTYSVPEKTAMTPDDLVASAFSTGTVERIISTAISYMKQIPPEKLIELEISPASLDREVLLSQVGTVSMLNSQSVPAWCIADTSLTEWSMLQRPTSGDDELVPCATPTRTKRLIVPYEQLYPLATAAAGFKDSPNTDTSASSTSDKPAVRKGVVVVVALVLLILVASLFSQDGESAMFSILKDVLEGSLVQRWSRLNEDSLNESANALFRPFNRRHKTGILDQPSRMASRQMLTLSVPVRKLGKSVSRSSDNLVSLQHRVLTGTRQLINLPILVAGIPFAVFTSALDSAMFLARLLHEKLSHRNTFKDVDRTSTTAHDTRVVATEKINGFKSAAVRMQRRVANVVEAAVWYLRGEPLHNQVVAQEEAKPAGVRSLDWHI